MFPVTGGMYVYLHEAFGPLLAFLYLWVTAIMRNNASAAVIALVFANYLIQGIVGECEAVPDAAIRLVATILVCECRYCISCAEYEHTNSYQQNVVN